MNQENFTFIIFIYLFFYHLYVSRLDPNYLFARKAASSGIHGIRVVGLGVIVLRLVGVTRGGRENQTKKPSGFLDVGRHLR